MVGIALHLQIHLVRINILTLNNIESLVHTSGSRPPLSSSLTQTFIFPLSSQPYRKHSLLGLMDSVPIYVGIAQHPAKNSKETLMQLMGYTFSLALSSIITMLHRFHLLHQHCAPIPTFSAPSGVHLCVQQFGMYSLEESWANKYGTNLVFFSFSERSQSYVASCLIYGKSCLGSRPIL